MCACVDGFICDASFSESKHPTGSAEYGQKKTRFSWIWQILHADENVI